MCLAYSYWRSLVSRWTGKKQDSLRLHEAGAQSLNDIHVAVMFRQPKTVATLSRMGLTLGLIFDASRSCWDLDVQANAERLCEYLQTERLVLSVGSLKCKAFMDLQLMDRRNPTSQQTLGAGLSHLKSLMDTDHWQSEQGRFFLYEVPHHSLSRSTDESIWHVHDPLPCDCRGACSKCCKF